MNDTGLTLHLFQGYGIELEYMIVDQDTLSVCPISDQLLKEVAGEIVGEIAFEKIAWSNELVMHVIELKTNGPCCKLSEQPRYFQDEIKKINQILKKFNAMLLPTGTHPFMNPFTETKLWPHDSNEIYEAYHKIFGCVGHGWSNLQSVHLNLPFANDEEFAKLHTAIRLLLPIIPALSASTPIIEGKLTGIVDSRLDFYSINQRKISSIAGLVVPEVIVTKKEYEEKILAKMYSDIAPFDPDNILQYEWLNSRGAIARFDRNTIEIRIIDVQECPLADLAILSVVVETLKAIIEQKWLKFDSQLEFPTEKLATLFQRVVKTGSQTIINHQDYLSIFGYVSAQPCSVKDLWEFILAQIFYPNQAIDPAFICVIQKILQSGNLAERILRQINHNPTQENLNRVYQKLASCLMQGEMFYA